MSKDLKKTIEYLANCHNPSMVKAILENAPDNVYKVICNAALNAYQGDMALSPAQKKKFKAKVNLFKKLTNKKVSIKAKRKIIVNQKGGFSFIPLLLSTVLSVLGPSLLSAFGKKE